MSKNDEKHSLKMFLNCLAIIIGIKLIILFFFFSYYYKQKNSLMTSFLESSPQFCFSDYCLSLEIADSQEKRELWLMFREQLNEWSGMIFVFTWEDYHWMWMRNMVIPLDIIWVDKNYEVVKIVSANPCEKEICDIYKPNVKNLFVIEIGSWVAKNLWLKQWDKIEILWLE